MSPTPKVVLITGCSDGGLGSALAVSMQKRGLHVLACVRNPSKASLLSELSNVTIISLDVTDKASMASAVETVRGHTGTHGLDILINNAGGGVPTLPLLDADLDAGRQMFEVNFWGVLSMCQAFAPLVIQAKGTIVNVSSVASVMHTPWLGVYGSSKAAVKMATDTLRVEMKPFGVTVLTGMVAQVASRFHDNIVEPVLPDGSIYKPAEKEIKASSTPGQGVTAKHDMPQEIFAERFAQDILNARSGGPIWRGGMASVCKWTSALLPTFAMVSFKKPYLISWH